MKSPLPRRLIRGFTVVQTNKYNVVLVSFFLDVDIKNPEEFTKLDNAKMVSVVEKDLKYFTKQGGKHTLQLKNETRHYTCQNALFYSYSAH